jgi:hypothetical protein
MCDACRRDREVKQTKAMERMMKIAKTMGENDMEKRVEFTEADRIQEVRERIFNRAYEENEGIENCFIYHPPKPGQPEKYKEIREAGKDLAYLLTYHCPDSAELENAMTRLKECIMWANASIARNE